MQNKEKVHLGERIGAWFTFAVVFCAGWYVGVNGMNGMINIGILFLTLFFFALFINRF